MAKAKLPAVQWTKHTEFHWQTRVHGDILDYWPTKNKWRFRGETIHGGWPQPHHRTVREFIAEAKAPAAKGKCGQCAHWLRGIGEANCEDLYGECKLRSTPDDTLYTEEVEGCEKWEAVF